jgi:poly(ADP-ribose) glycohydrolase ARH3
MRIVAVGLFCHDDDALYEKAVKSAEITHAHNIGTDGAAVQAKAVAEAVRMDRRREFSKEQYIHQLIQFSRTQVIRSKIELVGELINKKASPEEAASSIGRSVAVHESMPFSVYSFLRYPFDFKHSIYCAILNGGDRDTLGAMTGSISGAFLGLDALPPEWRRKLENREFIESLALGLYNKKSKSG